MTTGATRFNASFLQPFVSYILPTKTTLTLNTESTYDWENKQWTMPLNFQVSQLFKLGSLPMQAFLGGVIMPKARKAGLIGAYASA